MRTYAAVLVCLVLLLTAAIAYNQCSKKPCGQDSCPTPCPGTCPTASAPCAQAAGCGAAATCPSGAACATCGTCACADCKCANCDCATCKCANCPLKGSDKVTQIAGTVRYVRGTNSAVKVASGDQAVLLRVSDTCGQCGGLRNTLAALKRGDQVNAEFWSCPKSGRHYLVALTPAG